MKPAQKHLPLVIRLYESVGFVKDRLLPDCYGEKRDAYWMIKPAAKGPRPGP